MVAAAGAVRIAVYYAFEQSYSGFSNSTANGGGGGTAGQRGTVAFINTTENHLRVSSQALTFGEDASIAYNAITLENGAVLTIGGGSTINVVNSMNITGNSTIILQGKDTTGQVDGQWVGERALQSMPVILRLNLVRRFLRMGRVMWGALVLE